MSFHDASITEESLENPDSMGMLSATYASGENCKKDPDVRPLSALVYPNGNLTTKSPSDSFLVRVEGCYALEERSVVAQYVFPKTYSSNYVTIRRK